MKNACSFYIYSVAVVFFTATYVLPAAADGLYKWVDERGRVTYQNTPPPEDAASVERSAISATVNDLPGEEVEAEAPAEEAAVSETEEAEATEEIAEEEVVSITLFTNPECTTCEDMRAYFEESEIAFEEIDISEDTDQAEEMKQKHGHNNVPTIVVGNKSITGGSVNDLQTLLKNSGFEVPSEEE